MPIMTNRLIQIVGFPWAMRSAAFVILALLIVANATVRPRVAVKRHELPPLDHVRPFREPAYMFLLVGFFVLTFGIFIPINYIVVQARAAGMGSYPAEYLVPIQNGAR